MRCWSSAFFEGPELTLGYPFARLTHFLLSSAIPNTKSSLHIEGTHNDLSVSRATSIVSWFGKHLQILLLTPTMQDLCVFDAHQEHHPQS